MQLLMFYPLPKLPNSLSPSCGKLFLKISQFCCQDIETWYIGSLNTMSGILVIGLISTCPAGVKRVLIGLTLSFQPICLSILLLWIWNLLFSLSEHHRCGSGSGSRPFELEAVAEAFKIHCFCSQVKITKFTPELCFGLFLLPLVYMTWSWVWLSNAI